MGDTDRPHARRSRAAGGSSLGGGLSPTGKPGPSKPWPGLASGDGGSGGGADTGLPERDTGRGPLDAGTHAARAAAAAGPGRPAQRLTTVGSGGSDTATGGGGPELSFGGGLAPAEGGDGGGAVCDGGRAPHHAHHAHHQRGGEGVALAPGEEPEVSFGGVHPGAAHHRGGPGEEPEVSFGGALQRPRGPAGGHGSGAAAPFDGRSRSSAAARCPGDAACSLRGQGEEDCFVAGSLGYLQSLVALASPRFLSDDADGGCGGLGLHHSPAGLSAAVVC